MMVAGGINYLNGDCTVTPAKDMKDRGRMFRHAGKVDGPG